MENSYEKMSLAELRAAAKEKGLQKISTKKKQELLELLLDNKVAEKQAEPPKQNQAVPGKGKVAAGYKSKSKKEERAKTEGKTSEIESAKIEEAEKTKTAKTSESARAEEKPEKAKIAKTEKKTDKIESAKTKRKTDETENAKTERRTDKIENTKTEKKADKLESTKIKEATDKAENTTAEYTRKPKTGIDSAAAAEKFKKEENQNNFGQTVKNEKEESINSTGKVEIVRKTEKPNSAENIKISEGTKKVESKDGMGETALRRENNVVRNIGGVQRRNGRDYLDRQNRISRDNPQDGRRDNRPRIGSTNPYTNQNPYQNQNQNPSQNQNASTQIFNGNIQTQTPQEVINQDKTAGNYRVQPQSHEDIAQLDSGETKEGILEIMQEGYGFIRCDNFLPGTDDVYVSPLQIRRMNLRTGDIIVGNTKIRSQNEKFSALLYVKSINNLPAAEALKRARFEELTPIFPNKRIHLETPGCRPAMRMVDLVSPIGKGQRGMIVSQPKAGKTTLLKQIARAIHTNHPEMHMIILLIDERPEEVTDMKESIPGENVEVIYSTFDELPENHKRVSEMVIERAKRLVEHGRDVIILLDSITRLARAYNLTVQSSGRTLSGGLDPAALHMPKRFFGAARNMREGGSLTILATALVETGSRMDDVVFEEFKGTGNMELVLDRNLSEKRVFPAIDLPRSSTRRDDLLLSASEAEANILMRRAFNGMKSDDAVERIIQMFATTKNNQEFIELMKKTKFGC